MIYMWAKEEIEAYAIRISALSSELLNKTMTHEQYTRAVQKLNDEYSTLENERNQQQ